MIIPKPFGFPAWIGCKRRVAKKYINSRGRSLLKRYRLFHNAPHDTLISACAGLNEKPILVIPNYRPIGRKAFVLWDLDFEGPTNSCSFYNCGVMPAKSREECLQYIKTIIDYYSTRPDPHGFAERYRTLTLYPDGTYKMYYPTKDCS